MYKGVKKEQQFRYIYVGLQKKRKGGDHWVRDNLRYFLQASVY